MSTWPRPWYDDGLHTLRCTAKLLTRLKAQLTAVPTAPSTWLGEWYANLLFTRPAWLVLCLSERMSTIA